MQLGNRSVDGRVARAPHQFGRLAEKCRTAGVVAVHCADHATGRNTGRPGDTEWSGRRLEFGDRLRCRRRHRTQQPDLALDHDLGGGHAGQQRYLRVEVLDRIGCPQDKLPPAVDRLNLLRRNRQVDGTARQPPLDEQGTYFGQQRDRFVEGSGRDIRLYGWIAELGPAAYDGALHADRRRRTVGVEIDRPHDRWTRLIGQQAGGALGQDRRVQRHATVRQIHRLAAFPGVVDQAHHPVRRTPRRRRSRTTRGIPWAGAADTSPGRGPLTSAGQGSRTRCRYGPPPASSGRGPRHRRLRAAPRAKTA